MSISEELNKIKNAIYGREVRDAIHDGIKKTYDDASQGGNTNMEVSLARGGFQTLNGRLTNVDGILNSVSNSLNTLKNQKVDEVTFDIATQEIKFLGNGILLDTIDITEASNAQLVQDYIDSLVANNEIEGISVADGAITNQKIASESVTRDKLDINYNINYPWLGDETNDLDYIWSEGHYYVGDNATNNPFNAISVLKVERFKTTPTAQIVMVKQTLTKSTQAQEQETVYRVLRILEGNSEITWKKDWSPLLEDVVTTEKIENGSVTRDKLDNLVNNVFPWLGDGTYDLNEITETGIYMINGDVANNPAKDIAILEVSKAKTSATAGAEWIKQEVTTARPPSNIKAFRYYRIIRLLDGEITWAHNWLSVNTFEINYEGMEWVALGTSMTYYGEYTDYIASVLGLNLDNRGVGSGGITTYAEAGNTTMQAVESIEDFKGIVSIEVGPNDWRGCPLGELGDRNESTWYGAVDKVCRTISQRTSARAFFITSTTAAFQLQANFDESKRRDLYETNAHGHKYIDYVNAVKEVAQHYSIPVCDVFGESGLGSYHMNDKTLSDHIHLSDLGGEIWGNHIANFLNYKFAPFPTNYENPTINL